MLASTSQQAVVTISGWDVIGALVLILFLLGWVRRRTQCAVHRASLLARPHVYLHDSARYRRPGYPGADEFRLPAAVVPSPPSARPALYSPGPCRHEKILPVITGTGEHVRWVCANFPRCAAEFDKSVAIYEEAPREHG